MQDSTVFQIVSLEPTPLVEQVVQQAAERHSLDASFVAEKQFTAPVCGVEYHAQKFELSSKDAELRSELTIANCLQEIKALTEQTIADGFVEEL